MKVEFVLNGEQVSVDDDAATPLLETLRNDLKLNGPKFGCGLAQCGACRVLIDDSPAFSCVTLTSTIAGKQVTTLEGLGTPENPHPLQTAFIEEQALQCGYCASGIITTAAALLDSNPSPTEAEVRQALSAHLCRCGAQPRMIRAILRAAADGRKAGS